MTWPYSAYQGRDLAARAGLTALSSSPRALPPAALRRLLPVRRDARRGQPARLVGQGLPRARRPRRAGGRGALRHPELASRFGIQPRPTQARPPTPFESEAARDRRDRLARRRRADGRVRRRPRAADRRWRREPDGLRRAARALAAGRPTIARSAATRRSARFRANKADPPEAGRSSPRGHYERRQQHQGRPRRPRGDQGHRRGRAGAVGGRDRFRVPGAWEAEGARILDAYGSPTAIGHRCLSQAAEASSLLETASLAASSRDTVRSLYATP